MAKKTPPYLKETPPNQPQVKTDLSFEQVMHLAATTPKSVLEERIKREKKTGKTGKKQ
jgi:hypothetical protein